MDCFKRLCAAAIIATVTTCIVIRGRRTKWDEPKSASDIKQAGMIKSAAKLSAYKKKDRTNYFVKLFRSSDSIIKDATLELDLSQRRINSDKVLKDMFAESRALPQGSEARDKLVQEILDLIS